MIASSLGRLEKVDVRSVWANEASEFTPWLAQEENLALRGETIGIDLELDAQEKSVGPFRADILCKDLATDAWVLIENQLEHTDHSHLGQLLTYMDGPRHRYVRASPGCWAIFCPTPQPSHLIALEQRPARADQTMANSV